MPLWDSIVLCVIVLIFATFAIALGATCFYCRDRKGTAFLSVRRTRGYPTGAHLITDDD
jgi:hypothetical protein